MKDRLDFQRRITVLHEGHNATNSKHFVTLFSKDFMTTSETGNFNQITCAISPAPVNRLSKGRPAVLYGRSEPLKVTSPRRNEKIE